MDALLQRLRLVAVGWALLAFPLAAAANNLEPIGAQGPSTRDAERPPSAYQASAEASITSAAESGDAATGNAGTGNAGTGDAAPEARAADSGRRLTLSGESTPRRGAARPSAERGAALVNGWAESSAVTAIAALAFVVGLFMLFAWAMKRGMPKSAQVLPAEAVKILGRVPLGARQFGHLLQLGNKLVLVSVNQTGVEKLAEIDDPQEVVRMVALCGKTSPTASQKEFEEVFGQFGREKAEPGFLGSEGSLFSGGSRDAAGGHRYA